MLNISIFFAIKQSKLETRIEKSVDNRGTDQTVTKTVVETNFYKKDFSGR